MFNECHEFVVGCRSVANQVDYTYTRLRQNPFCEWCGSRLNREVAGYARMKEKVGYAV